ncbi:ABC transporter ATP-binding protein [Nordella sp. HKS 07]|uniref:ABC transporter ATP-binding protein n=1 Tax=Nordella sp. HKS 07 TaxID=2712222 RepID=UPI0013E11217|nr:ABC transporter ATP-binding protein [Nordella sp. HKS 07]QIG48911.1 ABC transporter ATP-binding protein [Nordella sp. HKS 07]
MTEPLLDIAGLSLEFPTFRGPVQALTDVSLSVGPGEIAGLVGESGCGKSVTTMVATRLLPEGRYRITSGRIRLFGRDPMTMSEGDLQEMRGSQVSTIFQEPMNALNPTLRVGRQITEVILRHQRMSKTQAAARARELLADMQIADPDGVMRAYPFELSGGMRQRVLIAMAFSCNPKLIIADEPTTALDVTVQALILQLIRGRARKTGTAVIFISHDMAVISQLCDRITVMYAGRVVERGATADVLRHPQHPYTRALLRCLPERAAHKEPLEAIPGTVPSLIEPPAGCLFRPRCPEAVEACGATPPFFTPAPRHDVACWRRRELVP